MAACERRKGVLIAKMRLGLENEELLSGEGVGVLE